MKHAVIFGLFCAGSSIQAMHTESGKRDGTVMQLRMRNTGGQNAHKDHREILPVPRTIRDIPFERSETHIIRLLYVSAGLCAILSVLNWCGIH